MTKKDYVLVASVINEAVRGQQNGSHCRVERADTMLLNITHSLCEALKRDNPRFDEVKFLTACTELN